MQGSKSLRSAQATWPDSRQILDHQALQGALVGRHDHDRVTSEWWRWEVVRMNNAHLLILNDFVKWIRPANILPDSCR